MAADSNNLILENPLFEPGHPSEEITALRDQIAPNIETNNPWRMIHDIVAAAREMKAVSQDVPIEQVINLHGKTDEINFTGDRVQFPRVDSKASVSVQKLLMALTNADFASDASNITADYYVERELGAQARKIRFALSLDEAADIFKRSTDHLKIPRHLVPTAVGGYSSLAVPKQATPELFTKSAAPALARKLL